MPFDPINNPVDYILLSNRRSPGIATISGASSPRRWDVRKGFALSGGRVVFRGIGFAKPSVTITLAGDQDWSDWHDWKSLIQRPPIGERARAMDIWHPILEDLGIVSVVVEDVLQPKQVADGQWDAVIKFIEYRRPVPMIETIGSSETQEDPVERYIEELQSQEQAYTAIRNSLP